MSRLHLFGRTTVTVVLTCALLGVSLFGGHQSQAAAACAALPTDKGTVTQTINVAAAGTYRVWSRLQGPDTNSNSFYMQIDNTLCNTSIGGSTSIPANTWTWVDYKDGTASSKIDVTLTAGNHTFTMAGEDANVEVDRVILTGESQAGGTTCTPTGTGDNCTDPPDTTPPMVDMTYPKPDGTTNNMSSTPTLTATASDGVAVQKVDFYVNGTKVGTDTTGTAGSYSYTLTSAQALAGGSKPTIYAIATDTSGNPAQSGNATATVADTTAPVISNTAVGSITQTSATVTWTTNESANSQVKYGSTSSYGSQTTLDATLVTSHSVAISGLTAGTTYHYQIVTKDASNNSAVSSDASFTTLAPAGDSSAPAVSMNTPAAGATVSGATVAVSATASDNVGVVGVQFKLGNNNLGTEDTTSPYSVNWDTTGLANGTYTLSAVARDAAGNTKTASNITVTVNNASYLPEDINQSGKVDITDLSLLVSHFNLTGAGLGRIDIDGSGKVDITDLSLLVSHFNQ